MVNFHCFYSLANGKQINDRYEFPLQLDLDRENGKYLSPEADRSVRNLYTLHRYLSVPFWFSMASIAPAKPFVMNYRILIL